MIQELLHDVTELHVNALDVSGNEHAFWPLVGDLQSDPAMKLAGIQLRLTATPFGEITRVWDVPAQFVAPATAGTGP
ncbi:MAG: hypothetical protein NT024_01480 [Proteobacteria bacterium]|nr:hypothetical protein [Pseudomonadota bacterium]